MMKKLFLLLPVFFTALLAGAQDGWSVRLNNKTLLNAAKENEQANSRTIKASEWKKNGSLEVIFKKPEAREGWIRYIVFVDENDNELTRKEAAKQVKISLTLLKKLVAGKTKIKIYTFSLPADPDLAARVRVRRVHLCTLVLP